MAVFQRVLRAVASAILLGALAAPASAADLQWSAYGTLTGAHPAFSLAQDPAAPAVTYAATQGSGLLRTDDGKTWRPVSTTLPTQLWRIAIDPAKGPQGAPPMYVGSARDGFFKSLDGGKTWTEGNQGLATPAQKNVRAIAMGVNQLVIGTSDGAFKSADGGKSWQPAGLAGYDVSAMAFARFTNPTTLVAAIDGVANPGSRLVLSKDLGTTWTPVKQGIPADIVVSSITAGPLQPGPNLRTLFLAGSAGVFKSDDQGATWAQQSGLPAQGYGSVVASPSDPNIVYVASDGGGGGGGGVWRSTDRGGTWTALAGGLVEKAITALSVGRDNPATLVAAAWNPDKPVALVYSLGDTQAPPAGQPEAGVCPEVSCQGGVQPLGSPPPSAAPSPSPTPTPCVEPATAPPAASPTVSVSAGGASPPPSASSSTAARPRPCPTPTRALPGPPRTDIPLPLAAGVVVVLGALLVGSIVLARIRG
ncbi:MAG: WD40/YVTN/BNR-like repeat-containing protein [Candidatus Dormibacteria bacterium]